MAPRKGGRSATPKRAPAKKEASPPAKKAPSPPKKAPSPKRAPSPKKGAAAPLIPASEFGANGLAVPVRRIMKSNTTIDAKANNAKRKFTPENDMWDMHWEFAGTIGAIFLMFFSHFIMYYLWVCIDKFQGEVIYPGHPALKGGDFYSAFSSHIVTFASPTLKTFGIFSSFYALQYILAVVLPGPVTYGLPVPSENGYQFPYKCNAVYAWYIILAIVGVLHFTEIFPMYALRDEFGRYMTAAVIWADFVSVAVFLSGFVGKVPRRMRMTGEFIYDFFMGSVLNPRLPGGVDLKMWAEIRNSWVLLFMLTLSCAAKQYQEEGSISTSMWFMILAHFLYVNACQKGEECIPTTWDIYYEKFGWMLIFWNFAGVPFVYCFQSLFLQTVKPAPLHPLLYAFMFPALIACYYIFDNINSQKNRFRMKRQGVDDAIIRRKTFPQLPYGYIENPKTLRSPDGKLELFCDGWYQYGRKIHYTVDMCMSFMWGASCGFTHFIPFFYFCFFFSHLTHRQARDDERCQKKYGKLWDAYVYHVPYKFIPYVY